MPALAHCTYSRKVLKELDQSEIIENTCWCEGGEFCNRAPFSHASNAFIIGAALSVLLVVAHRIISFI